jgi:hypothetical protein
VYQIPLLQSRDIDVHESEVSLVREDRIYFGMVWIIAEVSEWRLQD